MASIPMVILLAIALLSGVLGEYTSKYGPVVGKCPMTPLVRNASQGVAHLENAYLYGRKEKTDKALAAWLKKTNPAFKTTKLPTVALAHSGGGYRAMLVGAGLVKGFDGRDSDVSTSGLLQGMTYQVGLSGGAWLLSGLIGNNYPTISSIVEDHWKEALSDTALIPGNVFKAIGIYNNIHKDFHAKDIAGFQNTLVDLWGKLISYQLLRGDRWASTLSDVTEYSSKFRSNDMPFPIMTAMGVNNPPDHCVPDNVTSASYEFTPYEFGSWDDGVASFTQTHFLGTNYNNGGPYPPGECMTGYDNLGYILGTSSNILAFACPKFLIESLEALHVKVWSAFLKLVDRVDNKFTKYEYALFRNPFYQWANAGQVKDEKTLYLVDGAGAFRNVPLHPLLQPARNVDVVIAGDNSDGKANFLEDDKDNMPTGLSMYNTYQQSLKVGLNRMPYIPQVDVFKAQNLTKRPVFFGCWNEKVVTIVWLPNMWYGPATGNMEYSLATDLPTETIQIHRGETDKYIENGVQIATRGGDKGWAECLGCVMMKKMGSQLPEGCGRCWQEYCYEL